MFRQVFGIVLLFVSMAADASLPLEASLSDLACGADHFLIGRVVGVDMVDGRGRPLRHKGARTGPGLRNTIRLRIEVTEVIDTTATKVPAFLKVGLDPMMHFSLGQIRSAYTEPSDPMLVFLRGDSFHPVIAGRFLWQVSSRDEAASIRAECRK
jgi:hypothetical protein